jgi:hypothetical protein
MLNQRLAQVCIGIAVVLAVLALIVLTPAVAGAAPVTQEQSEPGGRLSAEVIVSLLAGGLAIVLEVVPGLQKRWDSLTWEAKRFLWLAGCLILGLSPPGLACLGAVLGIDLSRLSFVTTCGVDSLARGGQMAFVAFFASQTTHGLSKVGVKAVNYVRDNV